MNKSVAKKDLNDQQEAFLTALFGEANFDPKVARDMAGYSPNYSHTELMHAMREQIIDRSQTYLAMNMPNAVRDLVGIQLDPTQVGVKEKIMAIREILDRGGLVKTERVQHEVKDTNAVFILPPKKEVQDGGHSRVQLEADQGEA